MRRAVAATLLALAVVVVPASARPARAAVASIDNGTRASVRAAYLDRMVPALAVPTGWTGSTATCTPGAPSAAAQQATLDAINFARDLAGVAPVTFDAALSAKAQAAALIMDAAGALSHDPPSTWPCWTSQGHDGASHSNLALGASAARAIDLYLSDVGIASAGHRRWVLSPQVSVMGSGSTSRAHALDVLDGFDWSASGGPEWTAWPTEGYFPQQLEPGGQWSLSSGDSATDFSGATVTVLRNGTSLPVTLYPVANGYGSNTLVWSLDPGYALRRRDQRYDVTVSGIVRNGVTLSHAYSVTLFDADIDPDQTIAFAPLADRTYGDAPVALSATASSGLPVTFSSLTPQVCATGGTRGATLTLRASGTCTVAADQPGDDLRNPAPRVTRSFAVGRATLTVRAHDAARVPGAADPAFGYTVTGFVHGETLATSGVTGAASCGTTATAGSPPGSYPVTCDAGTLAAANYVFAFAPGTLVVGTGYVPLLPARLLDTRPGRATVDGVAAGGGALGPGAVRDLVVAGRGGVPATGAGAVVLNVTAVAPTTASYLTVWPADAPRPNASNLNPRAGVTAPNLVLARLGAGGAVSVFNAAGSTGLVADVVGWFPAGGSYVPLQPARLLDTRPGRATVDGVATGEGAVGGDVPYALPVTGRGGVPASGAAAVVLNLTAVAPSATTVVTAWPFGTTRPLASNLNPPAGVTTPGLVVVRVGDGGRIALHNDAGLAHLVADVVGWFPATPDYTPLWPARLLDTRSRRSTYDGLAAGGGALGSGATTDLVVTGRGGVPASGVGAVVLNVTAVAPSLTSYLTVWPYGAARPNASNLNPLRGVTGANLVVVRVGAGGRVSLFNAAGSTHLVADVVGWFPD
ncbi:MAG TPA: MBG domain-containing protein [Mycobacteriales bacterium]|jgi:uncharacterized protein YkwD|nr:MBG domain-containing protein [Mycobacteriales bacterium]